MSPLSRSLSGYSQGSSNQHLPRQSGHPCSCSTLIRIVREVDRNLPDDLRDRQSLLSVNAGVCLGLAVSIPVHLRCGSGDAERIVDGQVSSEAFRPTRAVATTRINAWNAGGYGSTGRGGVDRAGSTRSGREQGKFLLLPSTRSLDESPLQDTIVRWSAAKYLARIAERIPSSFSHQIVEALLGIFEDESELDGPENASIISEHSWHGACLSLAELARRGKIPVDLVEPTLSCVLRVRVLSLTRNHN